MKRIILLSIIICSLALALENTALNMRVPSGLEQKQLYFEIQHRIKGKIKSGSIGLGNGADVAVGLRYCVLKNIDINTSWIRDRKEYLIGASYKYYISKAMLKSQIDVQFFSYEKLPLPRRQNFFYLFSLQADPLGGKFSPLVNFGYDGYNQKFGLGLGGDLAFNFSFGPIESIGLIGEYYPVLDRDSISNGPKNTFAAGLKLNTYLHQFIFLAGNNYDIGPRRLMLGALNNDFHFGFVVNRFQMF